MSNPFADTIVYEPRRIEKSIEGLNEKPLRLLLKEFESLLQGQLPRTGRRLNEAAFLTSPQPGYGKSHLVGRLFRQLAGRATLIYIRPFADPEGCWQSILLQMIQEMDFPDRTEVDYCDFNEPRQLESFSHGVLAHLVADLIAARHLSHDDIGSAVKFLREHPGEAFDLSIAGGTWPVWMRDHFPQLHLQLVRQLQARAIRLTSASATSWLKVFHHLAFQQENIELHDACQDWLCGRSIAEEQATLIGLPPADQPRVDAPQTASEELAKRRVLDLCQLAGFFRPFVFCFDQTENYGSSSALVRQWAVSLEVLIRESLNSMVLITANLDAWKKNLRPHFEEAHRDRLRNPPLELQGVTREQAKTLIFQRLEKWPRDACAESLLDGAWVDALFANHTQIGVRQFLQQAREHWDALQAAPPPPVKTLEDIYKEYVAAIQTKPRRLRFDPDFFKWLVRDAAAKIPGLSVEPGGPEQKHFPIRWKWEGRIWLFGFEGGGNWRRWEAIMRSSDREHRGNPKLPATSVLFRTPELASIPGKNWNIAGDLHRAMNQHLHVVMLTEKRVAEMYACKDMHSDAIQGDLKRPPEEVLAFTAEKLKDWWTRLASTRSEKIQPAPANEAPPDPPPETDLAPRLRNLMQKEKFLGLTEVLAALGPAWTEEQVFKAKGQIPELKILPSDQMTVLLWQSST